MRPRRSGRACRCRRARCSATRYRAGSRAARRPASECRRRGCSLGFRGAMRSASREPAPPLPRPEVCVRRSRTVIGRVAGVSVISCGARAAALAGRLPAPAPSGPGFATATFVSLNSGMKRDTGSVETDLPFLDQHQDGDAGDRLGHRGDAEDAVLPHRRLRLEVHHPVRLEVGDLAAPRHDGHAAGDLPGADVALDHLVDPLQPLGGQTDVLRPPVRDGGRQRQRDGANQCEDGGQSPAADCVLHRQFLSMVDGVAEV